MIRTLILTACAALPLLAGPYDAVSQFSIGSNPNGVWSYGSTPTLGGLFTPFVLTDTTAIPGFSTWVSGAGFPSSSGLPNIGKNTTGSTFSFSTAILPTDVLHMHPGSAGQLAVLRFIAPSAGLFNVSGFVEGLDTAGTTTQASILLNGVVQSSFNVTGTLIPTSTNLTVAMSAGSTLDFAVGHNSNFNFDSTGWAVTINEAPEPSSAVLAAVGLLFAGWMRARR